MVSANSFSNGPSLPVPKKSRVSRRVAMTVVFLAFAAVPLAGAQVRVPDSTLVHLKLHYDLTTENVSKGDRIEFDVAENVVLNDHVVIPKGAVAWGSVIRVKGAGKKNAKDALVAFKFVGVHAIDKSEISLRQLPTKSKKSDSRENEIEENSPIPGLRQRMIGAAAGKDFAAYTDGDALVTAPDAPPPTSAQPTSPSPATTAGASAPIAPPPIVAPQVEVQEASVEFNATPSGADIVIDGAFVGSTPSTLRLKPGHHEIEIRMAGYRSWKRTISIEPGSHPSINPTLEKE